MSENSPQFTLQRSHYDEWVSSHVSPEVIAANNIRTIEGSEFEELFLSTAIEQCSDSTGTYLKSEAYKLRNRHKGSIEKGGWYCSGLDFGQVIQIAKTASAQLNLDDKSWAALVQDIEELPASGWGCFKSDAPRYTHWKQDANGEWQKHLGKLVKYEHPAKEATEVFAFNYPGNPRLWLEILADVDRPIVIVEGAKKAACLTSLGIVAIALPGVDQWNQPKTRELIDQLAIFARKGRTFYIAYDEDNKPTTRAKVNGSKFRLAAALKRQGAKVKIVKWDISLGKGVDDVVSAHGRGPIDEAIADAPIFEYWALKLNSKLSIKPDWVCPKGQKYLSGVPFPKDFKWALLKGPKGCGKTEEMQALVAIAHAEGRRVLFVSHRKMLTAALCSRAGVPTVYEVIQGQEDESKGYGLCVQSLHPTSQAQFEADWWDDALVIFDECEQVFWELLHSSTCKSNRVAILRELLKLIPRVLSPESRGQLLMADADLSDASVKFIQGMVSSEGDRTAPEPWLALSEYKGDSYQVRSFEKREELLIDAKVRIAAGEKILMLTDGQDTDTRYGTISLQQMLQAEFPHLKIGRVDSQTLSMEDSAMYGGLSHLDDIAADYDILICSPSVETGISLDIAGHFDRVVGFFSGVLSENSVRQFLARLRESVPRDIYVAPLGLNAICGGELSPAEFQKGLSKEIDTTLKIIYDAAREDIELNRDFCVDGTIDLSTWACRHNAGMAAYRPIIEAGLRDEGHTVTVVSRQDELKEVCNLTTQELSSQRQARMHKHGEALDKSDDLTDSQAAAMEKKNSVKNEAEALALEKALLKRMHPGCEVGPDLYVVSEGGRWHSRLKLHYALTLGKEFTKQSDRAKVEALTNGGAVWGLDVVRSTLSMKVAMLEHFKIPELLQRKSIKQDDKAIALLAESAIAHSRTIKKVLGFNVSPKDSPIATARKFLNTVGFGFGEASRSREANGKRFRTYPIEQIDHRYLGSIVDDKYDPKAFLYECDRAPIFEAWVSRDEQAKLKIDAAAAETAETVEAKEVEPAEGRLQMGQTLYKVVNKNSESGPSPSAPSSPPSFGNIAGGGQANITHGEQQAEPVRALAPKTYRYTGADFPQYQGIELELHSTGPTDALINVSNPSGQVLWCLPARDLVSA